jgi:hypothetical protein
MADEEKDPEYNLDDVDLFEERDNRVSIESEYLREELNKLDIIFENTESTPVIYPIEETLFSLHVGTTLSSGDTVWLALVGDIKNSMLSLDVCDFDEYHGDHLVPSVTDNVVLKIDQEEVEGSDTDVELQHIEFKILDVAVTPPEIPQREED